MPGIDLVLKAGGVGIAIAIISNIMAVTGKGEMVKYVDMLTVFVFLSMAIGLIGKLLNSLLFFM